MPVDHVHDSDTDSVSNHHIDPASTDTSSVQREPTSPAVTSSRPQVASHTQFEALAENNPARTPAQDNTGLRLNADSTSLNAFKQRRGSSTAAPAQHGAEHMSHSTARVDDAMGDRMEKMMALEARMANRQIDLKMLEMGLDFAKQLAGAVAKQAEPIR